MRNTKSSTRDSTAESHAAPHTPDVYLAAVPEPARTTLTKIRPVIRSLVPTEATEAISYGIPSFKYKGSLVCYAAFSGHCSFFPGAALIEAFKHDLKQFKTSKGTIQFPLDRPLSSTLVKKLVKARIAENERKYDSKKGTRPQMNVVRPPRLSQN